MKKFIALSVLGMFMLSAFPACASFVVNDDFDIQVLEKVKKPIKKPTTKPTTDQPKPKPKPHLDI